MTFALLSFNQEAFVREAVQGALAQSYEPLEVILSDDASGDGTFGILEELAAGYRGPHEVVVNRNPLRLGLGGHVNRIMELARGELVVIAAGDDVSLPQRTSRVVEEWLSADPRPSSLYSPVVIVDANDAELELLGPEPATGTLSELAAVRVPGLMGCSHAWSRELFDVFGPMLGDTVYEDRVLAFRAMMLGGVRRIDQVLVRYRAHAGAVSRHVAVPDERVIEVTILMHERNANVFANYERDLETAASRGLVDPEEANRTRAVINDALALARTKIRFLRGGTWEKLTVIASSLFRSPAQALRWTAILLAPSAYIRSQRKNMPGL